MAIFGDVFDFHNLECSGTTDVYGVEARDAAKYSTVHRMTAATVKSYLVPNICSAEVEKPCKRSVRKVLPSLY